MIEREADSAFFLTMHALHYPSSLCLHTKAQYRQQQKLLSAGLRMDNTVHQPLTSARIQSDIRKRQEIPAIIQESPQSPEIPLPYLPYRQLPS
jgi:hypothetical protein